MSATSPHEALQFLEPVLDEDQLPGTFSRGAGPGTGNYNACVELKVE